MIEKTLKTTQGNLKVKIPSQLSEITLEQLMQMQEKPDLNDMEAISILSGIPVDLLKNVRDINDFEAFSGCVLSLSHQIKHLYNSDAIPQKITFFLSDGTKTINVIRNLSVEPAGAFMAARDIIADEISERIKINGEADWQQYFNPSLNACCHLLAHYFYSRVTGKMYNEYEAEDFVNEIKKLRVTEALPIAKHFFTCYPNLSKPKTGCWHRLQQFWKKGQGYKHLKSLNTSTL
jgi:hypothetical protein